jgi:hypothetical protein
MVWGGLNPALTSWRNGLMQRLPNKDTRTDGARADKAHGSTSEHQEDSDGTVDAYDCDVNWLRSADPDGNPAEDRLSEAIKADFMADPRSRLWIHNRQIANKNVQNGNIRAYGGASPHTEHIHFEAIQALEDDGRPWAMPRTDALLRELEGDDMALTADEIAAAVWAFGLPNGLTADQNIRTLEVRSKSAEHNRLPSIQAKLDVLLKRDDVDEAAIISGLLAGLASVPADFADQVLARISEAIPADLAGKLADKLAARLAS